MEMQLLEMVVQRFALLKLVITALLTELSATQSAAISSLPLEVRLVMTETQYPMMDAVRLVKQKQALTAPRPTALAVYV